MGTVASARSVMWLSCAESEQLQNLFLEDMGNNCMVAGWERGIGLLGQESSRGGTRQR